ncbi:hypothetical protein SDC9_208201 [bioreactor metagenome]|uniref:Uncharacterized protein n=1 Tax=bioreactor metagenome TaxID=1076179 RepID=A0A645JLG2_9ZZZZ
MRLLLQISHRVTGSPHDLSLNSSLHTCNDFQECGFSGSVKTDYTNLCTIEKREVDIFQDCLVIVRQNLADSVHRENNLFVCHIILSISGKDSTRLFLSQVIDKCVQILHRDQ